MALSLPAVIVSGTSPASSPGTTSCSSRHGRTGNPPPLGWPAKSSAPPKKARCRLLAVIRAAEPHPGTLRNRWRLDQPCSAVRLLERDNKVATHCGDHARRASCLATGSTACAARGRILSEDMITAGGNPDITDRLRQAAQHGRRRGRSGIRWTGRRSPPRDPEPRQQPPLSLALLTATLGITAGDIETPKPTHRRRRPRWPRAPRSPYRILDGLTRS
jgi:hypothetical protein